MVTHSCSRSRTGSPPQLVRDYGFEPKDELSVEPPEGGGPIVEIAVIRAP